MTGSHQCPKGRLPSDSSALSFPTGDGDPPPPPRRSPILAKARLVASRAAITSVDTVVPSLVPGTLKRSVANAISTACGHYVPCRHTLYGQGASNTERPSNAMSNQLKNQKKTGGCSMDSWFAELQLDSSEHALTVLSALQHEICADRRQ